MMEWQSTKVTSSLRFDPCDVQELKLLFLHAVQEPALSVRRDVDSNLHVSKIFGVRFRFVGVAITDRRVAFDVVQLKARHEIQRKHMTV